MNSTHTIRTLAETLLRPAPAQLMKVTKTFGTTRALDGVDMTIHPGELVALLGSNGAGKTTAVRLLLGLSAPTSGIARVFGQDPRDAANRTRTGAMLQVARVPETIRVAEHIDLFSSYYPAPMPLQDVIEAAALGGLEKKPFGELSGGQKQRLLFALSICGNPDLLILDEPTVGLDVEARRAMWEQIRKFIRGGRSVLLTTHYLAEADALADRIIVIDRGKVIAEGTPEEVKSRAAGKQIRCRTALPLEAIMALPGVISARINGDHVEIACSESESLTRQLLLADATLSGLEISSAALEDAFVAITQGAHS